MFLLLCFVSCVVGSTCGPTPLLAIYTIKYNYTNIPFPCSSLLGGDKSHIQVEIRNMKDKRERMREEKSGFFTRERSRRMIILKIVFS